MLDGFGDAVISRAEYPIKKEIRRVYVEEAEKGAFPLDVREVHAAKTRRAEKSLSLLR